MEGWSRKNFSNGSVLYIPSNKEKLRIHLHEFMQNIQEELILLKGHKEPLMKISKKLARNYD